MIIATTKCRLRGHCEFVLEADDTQVPASYLQNIAATIEQMVAGGSVFKPDQTFQVGWMMTRVRRHMDGTHLTLQEPDMRAFPINWVGGVARTLRQMMLQLLMMDSFALRDEIDLPTILQTAIVCSNFTDADFFMDRATPHDPADSGWYIGCGRPDHDHNDPANLRRLSLYDAYLNQHGIQGFVGFPVGSSVVATQKQRLDVRRDGKSLPIIPGTFLDAWFNKPNSSGLPPETAG